MRKFIFCSLFLGACLMGKAQVDDLHTRIEKGVDSVRQLWLAKEYQDAFVLCFGLERAISQYETENKVRLPELHYKTNKQIFIMYLNSSRAGNPKCSVYFAKMEQIADELHDEEICLDFLRSVTPYYQKFGGSDKADGYYRNWMARKMGGEDSVMAENVYLKILTLAENNEIALLPTTLKEYHKQIQDSLRKAHEPVMTQPQRTEPEKEEQRLEEVGERTGLIEDLAIVVLAILTITSGSFLYVLFGKYRASVGNIQKSNDELKCYIERNTHRNDSFYSICGWMDSILGKIERNLSIDILSPDLATDIRVLQPIVKSIQEYMKLDNDRENMYERRLQKILPICQRAIDDTRPFLQCGVELKISVPNQSLPIYEEGLHRVLSHLLINAALNTSQGKITIEFKRRSPKNCQLVVTDTGCGIPVEKRSCLFTPFGCIDKLHESINMGLPICSIIAYRMSAELKYDNDYTHGARFILELHE
ncbi:MAG: ATP-binding protein [Bacteroidales bacterium]|nr:ATP-binding protein [Bacteroidales bacterium]